MIKTFDINWLDPSDLKKHITKLQQRRKKLLKGLGYNPIRFNSSHNTVEKLLPILYEFYDSVPRDVGIYYTYFHCNPFEILNPRNLKDLWLLELFPDLKYKPFYVGKGKNNRLLNLNRNDSHRKIRASIRQKGKDIIPYKAISLISERTSLDYENCFIDVLGLISLSKEGYLCNLDEGYTNRRKYYTKDQRHICKLNGFSLKEKI